MTKPICAFCCVLMRVEKNGVYCNDPEANGFAATYWMADRWICPKCDTRILVRARKPVPFVPDESTEFSYG